MRTPTASPVTGIKLWDSPTMELRLQTNRFAIWSTSTTAVDHLTPDQAYDLMKALEFGLQEWGRL